MADTKPGTLTRGWRGGILIQHPTFSPKKKYEGSITSIILTRPGPANASGEACAA
jgi:hypothetical protein